MKHVRSIDGDSNFLFFAGTRACLTCFGGNTLAFKACSNSGRSHGHCIFNVPDIGRVGLNSNKTIRSRSIGISADLSDVRHLNPTSLGIPVKHRPQAFYRGRLQILPLAIFYRCHHKLSFLMTSAIRLIDQLSSLDTSNSMIHPVPCRFQRS